MESQSVSFHWKTSLNVGALVTLVAAVHYFYMREFWVTLHGSPVLYRYIDWLITVPLMIELYLIPYSRTVLQTVLPLQIIEFSVHVLSQYVCRELCLLR